MAVDDSANSAATSALVISTPAASPNGDAPYCKSSVVDSLNWRWESGYHESNGSDLWPVTWGKDGNVYTSFGDGGGFGGDDYRGRTSFGIAMISGRPPPSSATVRNIYGGYDASHAATVYGKTGSIIAIGRDFYGIGSIYNAAESAAHPDQMSGAPNRVQLAYSMGNAYSWQASPWTFCQADTTGRRGLEGTFCPISFINYGRGNAGAPDGQVYILGYANSAHFWTEDLDAVPAHTYLARVPKRHLLQRDAYRYFTGVDARGNPTWSPDPHQMQPIFTDNNADRSGCGDVRSMTSPLEVVVYNAGLKRYIGVAQGALVSQTSFYEAPTPWGPWSVISYNNIDSTTGTGGWANLGITGGVSLGVHPVNAWTSSDGLTMWMIYSAGGTAPPGTLFPLEGTSMDSFNLVSVHLNLRSASRLAPPPDGMITR
jgi:hypothetical protein